MPNRPALVLLHAFPLDARMYTHQVEALLDVATVVAPDFRGFGQAPLGDQSPSLDLLADDVVRALDKAGVGGAVIAGTSMGGYVAMALLRRHSGRVRGLVLANTKAEADPPRARDNRLRLADLVEASADVGAIQEEVQPKLLGTTTRRLHPELVATVGTFVAEASPAGVSWAQRAMAARPDSHEVLASAQVPALILVGQEDELMPSAHGQAMVDSLPHGRLVQLDRAGHLACLEDPAGWNRAVRTFLDGL